MSCGILTPEKWHRFLSDQITGEEQVELLAHFESDCPHCQKFFETIDGKDDAMLRYAFHTIDLEHNEGVQPESESPVEQDPGTKRDTRAWNPLGILSKWFGSSKGYRPFPAWASSVAALAVVAILILPQLHIQPVSEPLIRTEKGIAPWGSGEISLAFAIGSRGEDGKFLVDRGVLNNHYRSSDWLFLHYEIEQDGYVYVLGSTEAGEVELLNPVSVELEAWHKAGAHEMLDEDGAKGISLQSFEGPYSIVAIYSQTPLDLMSQLLPIAKRVTGGSELGEIPELSSVPETELAVDVINFYVQ